MDGARRNKIRQLFVDLVNEYVEKIAEKAAEEGHAKSKGSLTRATNSWIRQFDQIWQECEQGVLPGMESTPSFQDLQLVLEIEVENGSIRTTEIKDGPSQIVIPHSLVLLDKSPDIKIQDNIYLAILVKSEIRSQIIPNLQEAIGQPRSFLPIADPKYLLFCFPNLEQANNIKQVIAENADQLGVTEIFVIDLKESAFSAAELVNINQSSIALVGFHSTTLGLLCRRCYAIGHLDFPRCESIVSEGRCCFCGLATYQLPGSSSCSNQASSETGVIA